MNYLLARIWLEKVAAEQRQSWFQQHPFLTSAMISLPLAATAFGLGRLLEAKMMRKLLQDPLGFTKRLLGREYSMIHSELKDLGQIEDIVRRLVRRRYTL
jgi:hypothetical protein